MLDYVIFRVSYRTAAHPRRCCRRRSGWPSVNAWQRRSTTCYRKETREPLRSRKPRARRCPGYTSGTQTEREREREGERERETETETETETERERERERGRGRGRGSERERARFSIKYIFLLLSIIFYLIVLLIRISEGRGFRTIPLMQRPQTVVLNSLWSSLTALVV